MTILAYSKDEDIYLKKSFEIKTPLSRLAIKLNRSYTSVQIRAVELNLLEAEVLSEKYVSEDEIEYNLLTNGFTEAEVKQYKGVNNVGISQRLENFDED